MDNISPFLSIIVPAYNVGKYLPQCMESILKQTYRDFEVVLINDGSTDDTAEICDKYKKTDSRVKVIHKKNGGLVSARKAGIEQARGEYIAYVDGDDWIDKEMFAELCKKVEETKADIVISNFIGVFKEKKEITQDMQEGLYEGNKLLEVYKEMLCKGDYFSFGFLPSLCGRVFRRDVLYLKQMQVDTKIRLGEDAACSYACLLAAKKIYYLKNGYYYYYRMRENSITHTMSASYYSKEIILLISMMQKEFNLYPELHDQLMKQLFFYTCYMVDNMLTPHLNIEDLFIKKEFKKQIRIIKESSIGNSLLIYKKQYQTSSRMRRIIDMIEHPNIINVLNLYLFRKYEVHNSRT